jgi:hypothetical protein
VFTRHRSADGGWSAACVEGALDRRHNANVAGPGVPSSAAADRFTPFTVLRSNERSACECYFTIRERTQKVFLRQSENSALGHVPTTLGAFRHGFCSEAIVQGTDRKLSDCVQSH